MHRPRRVTLLVGLLVFALVPVAAWLYRHEIRAWYDFRQEFERLPENEQGHPEYRHRRTRIIFVRLPGGRFLMGSPEDEEGRQDRETRHEAFLSPFLMAKHELTQARWHAVMGSRPSRSTENDLPVHQVSWFDCRKFCEKTGLSLPTEAQWEYACRAGTGGPFGADGRLGYVGWPGDGRLKAVARKRPNAFGLHDMHGNVAEWCEDIYDERFYSRPEAARLDPLCTAGSRQRVIRGGSSVEHAWFCRSAYRNGQEPALRSHIVGIRPVYNLNP